MASIGSGVIPLVGAQNVKVTNLTISTANTEVAHALSDGLKVLEFKARDSVRLQFSFTATESGSTYVSVPPCAAQSFTGLTLSDETLYLQASDPTVVEIIEFF